MYLRGIDERPLKNDNEVVDVREIALEVLKFIRGISAKDEDEKRIRRNQEFMIPRAICEASIDLFDLKGYIRKKYGRYLVDSVLECFVLTPRWHPKDTGVYVEMKAGSARIGSIIYSQNN
jgi:hypothetical protein